MTPKFFPSRLAFRNWLAKNHNTETELFVGYYKVATGRPSMTWSQSVDEALCFGWIDGIRRSIDEESYCIRFTPRKPTSTWSTVNIKKAENLIMNGLMQPAGLEIYKKRNKGRSGTASYESETKKLDEKLEKKFKEKGAAWEFFARQAPSYRRNTIHWIMSAKQEATRVARLEKTIAASFKQKRVY